MEKIRQSLQEISCHLEEGREAEMRRLTFLIFLLQCQDHQIPRRRREIQTGSLLDMMMVAHVVAEMNHSV